MPERTENDLSHFSATIFKVGRIQTITRIPTLPGDSIEFSLDAMFKMSELRRPQPVDFCFEMFAFWNPYRWSYEGREAFTNADARKRNWQAMLMAGADRDIRLPPQNPNTNNDVVTRGLPLGGYTKKSGTNDEVDTAFLNFMSLPANTNKALTYLAYLRSAITNKVPKHLVMDYNRVYRTYFMDPQWHDLTAGTATASAMQTIPTNDVAREFGYQACNLKTLYTTIRKDLGVDAGDYIVDRTSGNGLDGIDLRKLQEQKMRYRSETKRQWHAVSYSDIIKDIFKGSTDAEDTHEPWFLGSSKQWLSGFGSSGGPGLAEGKVNFSFPRKYFPEHGTILLIGLLRFPPVFEVEQHRLDVEDQFKTYHTLINEPGYSDMRPPEEWQHDWLYSNGTSTVKYGWHPVQMHYRTHPNYIHPRFYEEEFGFNYIPGGVGTPYATGLLHRDVGDETTMPIFRNETFEHAYITGTCKVMALRYLAEPEKSIYLAGV